MSRVSLPVTPLIQLLFVASLTNALRVLFLFRLVVFLLFLFLFLLPVFFFFFFFSFFFRLLFLLVSSSTELLQPQPRSDGPVSRVLHADRKIFAVGCAEGNAPSPFPLATLPTPHTHTHTHICTHTHAITRIPHIHTLNLLCSFSFFFSDNSDILVAGTCGTHGLEAQSAAERVSHQGNGKRVHAVCWVCLMFVRAAPRPHARSVSSPVPRCTSLHYTTLHYIHSTQYTVHSTQYIVHSTHSTHYTLHTTQYTVHSTQYTVHSTQYTVHSTQYTVHSTHSTHDTLHTTHYTTLHYTTLHYTTLHYTTLHYTTPRAGGSMIEVTMPLPPRREADLGHASFPLLTSRRPSAHDECLKLILVQLLLRDGCD
jgi:hypothetical protein